MGCMPTRDQVTEALRAVIDPELHKDIVTLEMVRSIEVHANGVVDVTVSLTTPGCPIRDHFQNGVDEAIRALDGVIGVNISFDVLSDTEKQALRAEARPRLAARGRARPGQERDLRRLRQGRRRQVQRDREPGGGARRAGQAGRRDGRRRLGLLAAAHVRPQRRAREGQRRAARSCRCDGGDGIKVVSIGFFIEQDAAVVWRGPMLHKALQQFLEDVDWGALDYLLIDLPPGTGDVSMTLSQLLPAGQVPDRHHAAGGRPEGRQALGRHGRQAQARDRRRDREHGRLHHARRVRASRSSARAAAGCSPRSSTCRCSVRCR